MGKTTDKVNSDKKALRFLCQLEPGGSSIAPDFQNPPGGCDEGWWEYHGTCYRSFGSNLTGRPETNKNEVADQPNAIAKCRSLGPGEKHWSRCFQNTFYGLIIFMKYNSYLRCDIGCFSESIPQWIRRSIYVRRRWQPMDWNSGINLKYLFIININVKMHWHCRAQKYELSKFYISLKVNKDWNFPGTMDIDLHTIIGSTATRKAVLVKNAQKCGTTQAVTAQRAIVRIFMY